MAPALAPALIGQEAAACALLGLVLGSVRAVFPVRGRAAFLPDMALVGAVLLGLQSYAAALSAGGVLRWYMPGSAFLCAFGAERLLLPACGIADAERADRTAKDPERGDEAHPQRRCRRCDRVGRPGFLQLRSPQRAHLCGCDRQLRAHPAGQLCGQTRCPHKKRARSIEFWQLR